MATLWGPLASYLHIVGSISSEVLSTVSRLREPVP
jgi:hypothetical protein